MLSDIIQRFPRDLEHFGSKVIGNLREIAAEQLRRDPAVPLEVLNRLANRRPKRLRRDLSRLHAADKGAKFSDLRPPQVLQLHEFAHGRLDIPAHQLANDLQSHLEADKALQRTVVKIRGNALSFL